MRVALFLAIPAFLVACGGSAPNERRAERSGEAAASFRVMDGTIAPDSAVLAELAPYRVQVSAQVSEVLATASDRLVKARPESALGALVTDAIMAAASELAGHPIHIAMLNNGGLRAPIPAGDVTLGAIYELMPFENAVTVVQLTGRKVQELADQIAGRGGEPIAGFSFSIDGPDGGASDVRIAGASISPNGLYWLATADFIANGGGGFEALEAPVARKDFDLLVREAIVQHVRMLGRLSAAPPRRLLVGGAE